MAEGFGLLFTGLAAIFNDDEWKLPEEDATELGDRLARWMRHGTKNVAAFEKKLAKIEPLVMLVFALLAVTIPRILHTQAKRRAIRLQKEAPSGSNGTRAEATASVPDLRVVDDATSGRNGDSEPSAAISVQKRRKPWNEVFGTDD